MSRRSHRPSAAVGGARTATIGHASGFASNPGSRGAIGPGRVGQTPIATPNLPANLIPAIWKGKRNAVQAKLLLLASYPLTAGTSITDEPSYASAANASRAKNESKIAIAGFVTGRFDCRGPTPSECQYPEPRSVHHSLALLDNTIGAYPGRWRSTDHGVDGFVLTWGIVRLQTV